MTVPTIAPSETEQTPDSGLIGQWPGMGFSGQGFQEISHAEIHLADGTSPSLSFDGDKAISGKRTFIISWADHLLACARCVGFAQREELGVGSSKLRRWLPEFHPKIPYLIARRCGPTTGVTWTEKESVASPFGTRYVNKYSFCELPVEYETPDYRMFGDEWINQYDVKGLAGMGYYGGGIPDITLFPDTVPDLDEEYWRYSEFDRYVSYDAKPSTKSFAPEPGGFYWGSTSAFPRQKFVGSVAMFLGFVDITWTWRGVPLRCLPFDVLAKSVGRVNKDWVRPIPGLFNSNGTPFACKPHQLYLQSYDIKKRVDVLGQWVADVVYQVRYNPVKWTRFYYHLDATKNAAGKAYDVNDTNESVSKWWYITQVAAGTVFYPGSVNNGIAAFDEKNFRDLFVPT